MQQRLSQIWPRQRGIQIKKLVFWLFSQRWWSLVQRIVLLLLSLFLALIILASFWQAANLFLPPEEGKETASLIMLAVMKLTPH